MTHTPPRLHRSELAVPGSNVRMLEKAPGLGADIVMLDLEDAVAPDDKPQARLNIIDALREQDWSGCSVSLRINGLDTHWCYRDVVDVVEEAGDQLDQIMIPKVSCAGDVHFVATLLDQIEEASACATGSGSRCSSRPRSGWSTSTRSRPPARRAWRRWSSAWPTTPPRCRATRRRSAARNPNYAVLTDRNGTPEREGHWGDQWHYALSRIAVTCRAHGLRPDRRAVRRLQRSRGLSSPPRAAPPCSATRASGRSTPRRSTLANEVFTPDAHIVDKTHRIIAAMRDAAANGSGAVSLDGRLIDAASIRMAETLLAKLEQIEAKENGTAPPPRARRGDLEERRVVRDRVLAPFADI